MGTKSPWVLGIASSHNGGACLLKGSEIAVAIQEERLCRTKRAEVRSAYACMSIKYCLDTAGIQPADLGCIVTSTWRDSESWEEDVALQRSLRTTFNSVPTLRVTHHMAHAIGAFASSGFETAAVMVVDGQGSPLKNLSAEEHSAVSSSARRCCHDPIHVSETISLYAAAGTRLRPVEKHVAATPSSNGIGMLSFTSLGHMYASVAAQIFGDPHDGPGKVMGLAAYGHPEIPADDFFEISDSDIAFKDVIPQRFGHNQRWPSNKREYEVLAASVQAALEQAIVHYARRAKRLTGERRLCYAGGVALNSIANERIVQECDFDDVYIMPAAEDSGTAIGAAYYGLWSLTKSNALIRHYHDACGRSYTHEEIDTAIAIAPNVITRPTNDVIDTVVSALVEGQVVGWLQGRSELGPRALGQRSILCDPRRSELKHVLNARIKGREPFRPFAPAVLLERVSEWFDVPQQLGESPAMLRVMKLRRERAQLVPVVAHVDGTSRVQTVRPDYNGRLYEVILKFYGRTGVPLIVNTSFNISGQPIVETPEDALTCFLATDIGMCVLDDRVVIKAEPRRSLLDFRVSLASHDIGIEHVRRNSGPIHHYDENNLKWFVSADVDSSSRRDRTMDEPRRRCLRIVGDARWGRCVTLVPWQIGEILIRADGSSTMRQLVEAVKADVPTLYSEAAILWLLVRLCEANVLRVHPNTNVAETTGVHT